MTEIFRHERRLPMATFMLDGPAQRAEGRHGSETRAALLSDFCIADWMNLPYVLISFRA